MQKIPKYMYKDVFIEFFNLKVEQKVQKILKYMYEDIYFLSFLKKARNKKPTTLVIGFSSILLFL